MFCGCDDHRTENVILIIWRDWPELLPGQVEKGTCRKQSSHVAKRLGKEMLAEGGSPWDRTDDIRNRNVSYFQGTVIEEASVTGGLWPNFFACISGKLYQITGQRDKNRHKRTQKNSIEAIASGFAHTLPNVRVEMTPRELKAFCKTKQNQFRCLFWSRADRGLHNMPQLMETRDRVGRHQLLINQQGQSLRNNQFSDWWRRLPKLEIPLFAEAVMIQERGFPHTPATTKTLPPCS